MSNNKSRISKKHKKRKKRKLFSRIILLLFLGIIGYGGYLIYSIYNAANESYVELDRGEKSQFREKKVEILKDPISILLIGIENYSSEGDRGRTDSIIVATLNPTDKSIKLLSIPRDTRVFIDKLGYKDKINHAYGYGGKELTIETVEHFLDMPIDYYATINFDGFKYVIDEIGGVTVDVPFDFSEISDGSDGKKKHMIYFQEGEMTLNGEEALAYARMRKQDPRGDFGRGDRQKQILTAAINKMASPTILLSIDDIAKHVGDNVQTNIAVSKAYSFQKTYSGISSSNIENLSLQGTDNRINGIYYFEPNKESLLEIQRTLKEHLNISQPTNTQK